MELPAALAPWAGTLDLFPRPLALALGPMVRRLDLAIGPPRAGGRPGAEPDGLDGIGRRGSYERLLLSEWLLADEAPDEFLRRAANAEHGFLQIARREPGGSSVCLVLFDAGPGQLGAPRLAHLAALVVMARRARAAGSRLVWGIAQKPAAPDEEVSPAAVRRLLQARGGEEVQESHLEAWRKSLAELGGDTTELWIVGSSRIPRLWASHGAAILEVRDPLDPEARELEARVLERGQVRPVTLPLPDEPDCAHLLRDPFDVATPPPARAAGPHLAPASNLVFLSYTKLAARSRDRGIVVYPVPNSPHAGVGKPRLYRLRSGYDILAVGRLHKALLAVTTPGQGEHMRVECLGSPPNGILRWLGELEGEVDPAPDPKIPLGVLYPGPREEELFVQIGDRPLSIRPREASGGLRGHSIDLRVAALGPHAGGITGVYGEADWILQHTRPGVSADHETLGQVPANGRAFLGFGGGHEHSRFGLVAMEQELGQWRVLSSAGQFVFRPPDGTTVQGIAALRQSGAALLILEADRHTLSLVNGRESFSLPRASGPIEHVTACPTGPVITYATVDGEVVIYSLHYRSVLYRLTPSGPVGGDA